MTRLRPMREVIGWDVDNVPAREQEEPSPFEWEEFDRIWKYLWSDERLLLCLYRDGKTYSEIAHVMRYVGRMFAHREVQRAIGVARFFAHHVDAIERMPSVSTVLKPWVRRILHLLVVERKRVVDIADEVGVSERTVGLATKSSIKMLRKAGENVLAEAVSACYDMCTLRTICGDKEIRRTEMDSWRIQLKRILLECVGCIPYVWGGQSVDFKKRRGEADCSGLVIEALKYVRKLPKTFGDTTAAGLSRHFRRRVQNPSPGDLVFYGNSGVTHVMFYLGQVNGWEGSVIGMCGGRRGMQAEEAKLLGANLWVRSSIRYRRDFAFCRRIG